MIQQRETFFTARAARLTLGLTLAIGLGAAVAASPMHGAPAATESSVVEASFAPLADGPGMSVQRSFGKHDEDCVTVTQVRGADGRVYPTRGMVCSE